MTLYPGTRISHWGLNTYLCIFKGRGPIAMIVALFYTHNGVICIFEFINVETK